MRPDQLGCPEDGPRGSNNTGRVRRKKKVHYYDPISDTPIPVYLESDDESTATAEESSSYETGAEDASDSSRASTPEPQAHGSMAGNPFWWGPGPSGTAAESEDESTDMEEDNEEDGDVDGDGDGEGEGDGEGDGDGDGDVDVDVDGDGVGDGVGDGAGNGAGDGVGAGVGAGNGDEDIESDWDEDDTTEEEKQKEREETAEQSYRRWRERNRPMRGNEQQRFIKLLWRLQNSMLQAVILKGHIKGQGNTMDLVTLVMRRNPPPCRRSASPMELYWTRKIHRAFWEYLFKYSVIAKNERNVIALRKVDFLELSMKWVVKILAEMHKINKEEVYNVRAPSKYGKASWKQELCMNAMTCLLRHLIIIMKKFDRVYATY